MTKVARIVFVTFLTLLFLAGTVGAQDSIRTLDIDKLEGNLGQKVSMLSSRTARCILML